MGNKRSKASKSPDDNQPGNTSLLTNDIYVASRISPQMDDITNWLDTFPTSQDVDITELQTRIKTQVQLDPHFLNHFNSNGDTILTHILKTKPTTTLLSMIYNIDHGLLLKCTKDPKSNLRAFHSSPLLTALEYQVSNDVLEWLFDYNVTPLGEFDSGYHLLALLLKSQMFDQSRLERLLPYIARHIDFMTKNYNESANTRIFDSIQDLQAELAGELVKNPNARQKTQYPINPDTGVSLYIERQTRVESIEQEMSYTYKAWSTFQKLLLKYSTPSQLFLHPDMQLITKTSNIYLCGISSYVLHPGITNMNSVLMAANAYAPGNIFELLCKNGAVLGNRQNDGLIRAANNEVYPISVFRTQSMLVNTLGHVSQNNYQASTIAMLCSMGHCNPNTYMHSLKSENIIRNYQSLSVFNNHKYYSIIESLQDHPHPFIAQWFLPLIRRGPSGRYGDYEDLSVTKSIDMNKNSSDPRERVAEILFPAFQKRSAKFHYANQHTDMYNLSLFGMNDFGKLVSDSEGLSPNTKDTPQQLLQQLIDYWGFYLFSRYSDLWSRRNDGFWKQYKHIDDLWDQIGNRSDLQLKTSILVHLAGSTYLTKTQKHFPHLTQNIDNVQSLNLLVLEVQDNDVDGGDVKDNDVDNGQDGVNGQDLSEDGDDPKGQTNSNQGNTTMRTQIKAGSTERRSSKVIETAKVSEIIPLEERTKLLSKMIKKKRNSINLRDKSSKSLTNSLNDTNRWIKSTKELAKANLKYYLTVNSGDYPLPTPKQMGHTSLNTFYDLCTNQSADMTSNDTDDYISSTIPTGIPQSLHQLSILTQHFPIPVSIDPTIGVCSTYHNYGFTRKIKPDESTTPITYGRITLGIQVTHVSPTTNQDNAQPFVLTSLACQGYMPTYKYYNTSFLQYIYDTHPYMEYQESLNDPSAQTRREHLLQRISIESKEPPTNNPDDIGRAVTYDLDVYYYPPVPKVKMVPDPLREQAQQNQLSGITVLTSILTNSSIDKDATTPMVNNLDEVPITYPGIKFETGLEKKELLRAHKSLDIPLKVSTGQINDTEKRSRSAPHQFLTLTQLDQISIATSGVCFVDPTEVTQSQRDKSCSVFMTDLFRSKEYTQIDNVLSIADQLSDYSTFISDLNTAGDEEPQALPTSTVSPMNKHPYTPRCILNNTITHRAPDNRYLTSCSLIPTQYINYHVITNNHRGAKPKNRQNSQDSQTTSQEDLSDINMPLPYLFDSYGIIQNFNPHNPPGIVWYLLLYAPVNNEDDMFDVLKRCRVDLVNQHYQTTLMYSVIRQSLPKIVQMFLSLTANPNQQDGYLRTVLHYISMTGYWHRFIYNKYQHMNYPKYASELVDFLYNVFYQYGCLVNVIDIGQHSPLSQAVLTGSPGEMLKMLFDFSISLTTKQSENQSTVFISRGMSDLDVPFTYGYSINCPSRDGYMKLIEKFNKETGLKKSEHVPLNTNCGDTQSLSSVSTLLSQLNSLIADQYPINPVPDWVDCHESLGFGTVLTPQQILQRQYAAGMVKIHQTIAILEITKALKGKQHQFTIEQIQQIFSKPSSNTASTAAISSDIQEPTTTTASIQGADENEQQEALETKQTPTINQPYANLTFSSKLPNITSPPPQAWRTTTPIQYETSIPQPIYIHPELYTTGFVIDQQQGNESDTSPISDDTSTANDNKIPTLLKQLTTTTILPPPPHPTKSLFGFRRGNNYTDVFYLLRPLYHNTATYSVYNQLSQDTMKRDILQEITPYSHQFSPSSTQFNPQLTQTYSIFDLMVFQTFMSHGVINKMGNISIFSYPFSQFDSLLASPLDFPPNESNWRPDIMRIWKEHCEPEYVIKPDVWSHFFATILFSFRLFVFFDQIKLTQSPSSTPTSTLSSLDLSHQTSDDQDNEKKTIIATLENAEKENVFMNTGHTFTVSLHGPSGHPQLNASNNITKNSEHISTTPQLLSVTKTLDAYLETMVKLPGVIDECINLSTSLATSTEYQPTPAGRTAKAPFWAIQIREGSAKLARYQNTSGMFSVKSALPPGIDQIFTQSSDIIEKEVNTTVQKISSNQTGESVFPPEHLIWSFLTHLLLEVTVGTHRVPANINKLAHWKDVTLPYWAAQDEKEKLKPLSSTTMMYFAHLIFKSFISDGVKLATKWFQEYLDAFGQSIQP